MKRFVFGSLLAGGLLLVGCGSTMESGPTGTPSSTTPDGGGTGATGGASNPNGTGGACASSDTWNGYAEQFFATNCAGCHGAGKTPGTTVYDPASYSSVAGAATKIAGQISAGTMPRNATLSAADKARILAWLACSPPPQ
jgi:hypothetical protein